MTDVNHAEPIVVHRLTIACDRALVALVDDLRRSAEGALPSRSEIVREAIEEKAARTLGVSAGSTNGNGRTNKGSER